MKSSIKHRKIQSNDFNLSRTKSRQNIKNDRKLNSPNNIQAPSLVERCQQRYKNSVHTNFLKKGSGHEYDPKQSAAVK